MPTSTGETCCSVLGKPPEEITHGERSMAKMVNFGLRFMG